MLELSRRLRAFLNRHFPSLVLEHEDLAADAIAAHASSFRGDNDASRLTHAIAILSRNARRLAKKRSAETATLRQADAQSPFVSGKRPRARAIAIDPTQLHELGQFHQHWARLFASGILNGSLLRDTERGFYESMGSEAARVLGRSPDARFVTEIEII